MSEEIVPHIFHVIPSFAHGGVPIRISYLINHFDRAAKHTIFSTNNDYSCRSRINDQVDFSIADIKNADQGNIIQRVISYRKIIKDIKPDLLLTYQWGAVEWALANSFLPLCRHFHLESGFGPDEAFKTMPRRNLFRRLALRNIDGVIVPSQNLVRICKSDWKIDAAKIQYIPNGVDCHKYASEPKVGIIPGFKKQEVEIVIGTMTPLRPEKNLKRLIIAFNQLMKTHPHKKFRLIIMGEGDERSSLEKLISSYDLTNEIFVPGHIRRPRTCFRLVGCLCNFF